MHIGYSKSRTVKILRTKHTVCFRVGTTAQSLADMLKSVPPGATVDEVFDDEDEPDVTSITFHEEGCEQ